MNVPMSVSLVITTYNAQAFIMRAVSSALEQTHAPLEIIIVDDCSTDGTPDLLGRVARAHDCIRVMSTPYNGGPSVARNVGLGAARGDWIAFLDADDAFAPDRLDVLMARAAAGDCDAVADDLAYYDAMAGQVTGRAMGAGQVPRTPISLREYIAHNRSGGDGFDWGLLKPVFRREFMLAHGIRYDPVVRHGEDFLLMIAFLMAGGRFFLIDHATYLYTQRQGSVSGRASGMSRTVIAYRDMHDTALALARDPRIRDNPELVALLHQRAAGLQRLDDSYFVSVALRSGAVGAIFRRIMRRPAFLPAMIRQVAAALRRRLCHS
ncbi:glycosyltransferase family 2 protein [Komagataeibacter swingsii]|uniref:Glycosyltransferase family 2 protein n=1 Tax=Komagataeibacter swingsii TaxID=215220 RepID=A0A850NZ79_9PROT|nr:glycosyltransferase family 2 protein [Komagataeibacter swingsii]AHI24771.1 glycosyltransferase [Komagataeibacter xylinus E25]NVN36998.1 glycosyltransferase family 2 protein [Komagataeibacter swingsii]RFP03710.1 glycosyltransferase [Komagataeibacter xylinus]RFP04185.1 glycosyltransferase [Komagataeibacter xylinus]